MTPGMTTQVTDAAAIADFVAQGVKSAKGKLAKKDADIQNLRRKYLRNIATVLENFYSISKTGQYCNLPILIMATAAYHQVSADPRAPYAPPDGSKIHRRVEECLTIVMTAADKSLLEIAESKIALHKEFGTIYKKETRATRPVPTQVIISAHACAAA